jgi:two-component system, response regulator YesN
MFKTMLVEDNPFYRKAFRDNLQLQFPSMEIDEASNGTEALKGIVSFGPNLIFMDIHLPDENGLQLTERIKHLHPDITVAILTSHDLPEYREAAARFKADQFLLKDSITSEELDTLVKLALSKKGVVADGSQG